jgi:hypothetical protein
VVQVFDKPWSEIQDPPPGFEAITTGIGLFAKCLRHSANHEKHSVKSLPSVTLGKESSANCTSATAFLSSTFYRALGKDCHKVLDKEKSMSWRLVMDTGHLPSVLGYPFAKCSMD